jgi:hypothetical protein
MIGAVGYFTNNAAVNFGRNVAMSTLHSLCLSSERWAPLASKKYVHRTHSKFPKPLDRAPHYTTNEAASITSPPNESIPEHQSSQFPELFDEIPAVDVAAGGVAVLLCNCVSSNWTSSPLIASPKLVCIPGLL